MSKRRVIYFVNNQLCSLFLQRRSNSAYISLVFVTSYIYNFFQLNLRSLLPSHVLSINMTHVANYDNLMITNVNNSSLFDYHHDKYKLCATSAYTYNEQILSSITTSTESLLMSLNIIYTLHMLTFFSIIQAALTVDTHCMFLIFNLLSTCTKHMQLLQLSSQ